MLAFSCDEVLAATEFAHENGWAHLDIRPSSIVVHRGKRNEDDTALILIDGGCAAKFGR